MLPDWFPYLKPVSSYLIRHAQLKNAEHARLDLILLQFAEQNILQSLGNRQQLWANICNYISSPIV